MSDTKSNYGVEDAYIGRTSDGGRMYVSIEIRTVTHDMPRMTVYHNSITTYTELSVSGLWIPKFCRTAYSAGQNIDDLRDVTDPTIHESLVRDLIDLWERCHLNGMNAACCHQDRNKGYTYGDDWRAMADAQTGKCPQGYRYGSQWLIRPLMDEDVQKATQIAERLSMQPKYRGG